MTRPLRTLAWTDQPNIGDRFTSLLFDAWGVEHTVTNEMADAEFVGVGSLLEQVGKPLHLTIWGTGRTSDFRRNAHVDLTSCTVLALRGPLTAMGSYGTRSPVDNRKGFVLGDPGLLAADLVDAEPMAPEVVGELIVPHWEDQERMKSERPGATFGDVLGDPILLLRQIREADVVISSSLHGLIFADALGVPRVWDWFDGVPFEGFKFRDYAALVGRFNPGDEVKVPESLVDEIASGLREVFHQWHRNVV
jgi:hypothetical protein